MTLWVKGLSVEADPGNTIVEIAGVPHFQETVLVQSGQINVRLRPRIRSGIHEILVRHREAMSRAVSFQVVGNATIIHGLENVSGSYADAELSR